jgi:nicotinamide mononucleotide (NMN) deamidase PncC
MLIRQLSSHNKAPLEKKRLECISIVSTEKERRLTDGQQALIQAELPFSYSGNTGEMNWRSTATNGQPYFGRSDNKKDNILGQGFRQYFLLK